MNSLCYFIFNNTMFGCGVGSGFGLDFGEESGVLDFGDFYVHVDAVEEGTRKFFGVVLDLSLSASAFVRRITEIATRAGVHSSNKHEICGVSSFRIGTRDGYLFVF